MPTKMALVDYKKCHPEKCDSGICAAALACSHKLLKQEGDEPVLQDIAHMQVHGDWVEIETFFGEEKVIPGRVVEIDFSTSKILLDQHGEHGKA